jgi:hypothetical protein
LHKGVGTTKPDIMESHEESTYALLVRSEEKSRGVLETVLYAFFILSAIVSIWQFAQQPIRLSAPGLTSHIATVTVADEA